jgi:hypothetical protein
MGIKELLCLDYGSDYMTMSCQNSQNYTLEKMHFTVSKLHLEGLEI